MKIFWDMSSVIWTALRAGKDTADGIYVNHNGKEVLVNSAAYGYENAVNHMVAELKQWRLTPEDAVLVFEGKDSKKRRCMIDPQYKAKRDADKPPEAYEQFNLLKNKLKQTFRDLGAIAVSQDYVEGDDILAWLAQHTEQDAIVSTYDNDLVVLHQVNAYGAKIMVSVKGEVALNKYGDFDLALVTLYKSLVGDSSDNVKGSPGFGPTAFMKLIATYGEDGAYELLDLLKQGQRDQLAVLAKSNGCKLLQKIVDTWEDVVKSYKVVLLHPEWVNTIRQQLTWEPGMVKPECDDERLRQWKGQARLVTAENYDAALAFLKEQVKHTIEPAFDIETSTPDESDDWLEAVGNPGGVDTFGSYLVGFSLTFGSNHQYTYYVSVKHKDTRNITMKQAREMIECLFTQHTIIHNTAFELPVLHEAKDEDGSLWRDHWAVYGENGFLPKALDTKIEASYVDENQKLGLKLRSKLHLGYTQATFEETMSREGLASLLPKGGRVVKAWTDEEGDKELRQYKMHEMTAKDVFHYGADDTICTAALHNYFKFIMQLEHCWNIYLDVEIGAAYQHAKNFVDGVSFSLAKMRELEAIDTKTYDDAWAVVKEYLTAHQWEGTVAPTYTKEITAKEIKDAYRIVFKVDDAEDEDDELEGEEDVEKPVDPFLSTRVRTPAKLVLMLEGMGEEYEEFAKRLRECLQGNPGSFEKYVHKHFTGEPRFKMSNKMMCELLYTKMGLPIRVRNKPTEKMKQAGLKEGNPKADNLAIAYALQEASPEQAAVLDGLKLMQMVTTRRNLYYKKYPYLIHWKDGKIHSSHNQCATNTRRASSSGPNLQQLPKHPKVEGQPARFRETFVPHRSDAVVVSMDFAAQELRVIAEYSQDKNMLACFVGANLKDMHALTGVGIMAKADADLLKTYVEALEVKPEDTTEAQYAAFVAMADGTDDQQKKYKLYRALGKKVNFTTEYGAAAPKLAMTMLIDEDTAQDYIDARENTFYEAKLWKEAVVDEAKTNGVVRTMLGAPRHLAALLNSDDKRISSKAERQAVNFKIQSSSAEMTKLAEGRMWKEKLAYRFDAVCYGPIHDEVVWSVKLSELAEFSVACHACMVAPYATMQVPIESSISWGPDFGVQYEVGAVPGQVVVDVGLEKAAEAASKAV